MTFESFNKISRLNRDMVVSEKLNGTNAQIYIATRAELPEEFTGFVAQEGDLFMFAGSRSRWIQPGNDNYGFAGWVVANREELFKLGPGRHYGEWWGQGIQGGYGLKEKRFWLFDVGKWNKENLPSCVGVVPTLYTGLFSTEKVNAIVSELRETGSVAAPGAKAEGVVVFHTATSTLFKVTCENDEKPKGQVNG